jgi:hypothetical protein
MILVITSITLRSPFHFFSLSYNAMHIMRQLKDTPCKGQKSRGFWTDHYTQTLWPDETSMKAFAHAGAHKEVMSKSAKLATELATLTLEAEGFLPWKEAIGQIKKKGKILRFS